MLSRNNISDSVVSGKVDKVKVLKVGIRNAIPYSKRAVEAYQVTKLVVYEDLGHGFYGRKAQDSEKMAEYVKTHSV